MSSPTRPETNIEQLQRLYAEAVTYVRHVEADLQHSQAQQQQIETIYAEAVAYSRHLEQALVAEQHAASESRQYIAQLEAELAALRHSSDEGRRYAESLERQLTALTLFNRQLEIRLHDSEENLRQYRES